MTDLKKGSFCFSLDQMYSLKMMCFLKLVDVVNEPHSVRHEFWGTLTTISASLTDT